MLVVAGVGVTARLLVAGHSSRQAGGPPYTQQNMSRWLQIKSIWDLFLTTVLSTNNFTEKHLGRQLEIV